MVKIGFGAFSTVWLARDLDENRWVAVKICCGIEVPQRSSEASILSEIRESSQGKAGVEQVLRLFDDFIIKGPNGFHQCLITEVVAPLTYSAVRERCSIDALRQIMEGFAFLHEQGISHGDPHISNLGVALPQLEELDEQDMADLFPTEMPFPVMSHLERKPLANLPAFMVALESLAGMLEKKKLFPGGKKLQIKILGFGRAHKTSEEAVMLKGSMPAMMPPPELLMHDLSNGDLRSPGSQAADVWVIACTIFHVISGQPFSGTWSRKDACLTECLQFGGPPVESWLDFARSKLSLEPDARRIETLMLLALVRYRTNRERIWVWFAMHCHWDYKDDKIQVFFDLLKKMMVTDPEKRISIQEAMAHPFLLYEELRLRRVDETTRRNKPAVPAENPIIDWGKSPATEVWEDEEQYVLSGMEIGWDDDKK
ncbi:CMGC/SRPK protein kinase [Beauveria bassiana ARSEF 2860]|uniref:CMGC/SRPK protein kinase n=1 Tax=Beauveria bassiana (strain ARSEF 2860) TaxID=655819 RepID=J4KNK2_BEAB2|nr:CMGC/SRPK protein kinase [Beauveria bassiana ARSEF 2860]EJP65849.1 CMGC/SRPK protein kinase [Beauveria bassiana ARSEF 2860]